MRDFSGIEGRRFFVFFQDNDIIWNYHRIDMYSLESLKRKINLMMIMYHPGRQGMDDTVGVERVPYNTVTASVVI